MKLRYQVVFALVLSGAVFGQEFRGAISGAVTDPAGGTIAGAKVTVTEIRTNTRVEATTESTGQYTAPFLLPGDYDVAVKMAGFKEYVRKGIHVGAGERPVIDIRLDVGDATVSVEVTAEVPLVNSENASIGHAITTKEVEDLPLNGGSPWMLSQLEIGVIYSPFNSNASVVQTYDSSNNFSIAGTPTQSSEMLLNGAPNATWDMRSAYTPPKDAVQEVRTTVLNTDASFGHTRGGTINMVMKIGNQRIARQHVGEHAAVQPHRQQLLQQCQGSRESADALQSVRSHGGRSGLSSEGVERQGQAVLVLRLAARQEHAAVHQFHQRTDRGRKARRFFADPADGRDAALRPVQRLAERQRDRAAAASGQHHSHQPDQSDHAAVPEILPGAECERRATPPAGRMDISITAPPRPTATWRTTNRCSSITT